MDDLFKDVQPMVYESRINVPYNWWAGDTASRIFISLRDDRKILGTCCQGCGKVYVPPRKTCPTCFTKNADWRVVSSVGTLESFTITRRQLAALPAKVPVIYGLIKLDGADTAMLHLLDEVDPEKVRIGMRVQARFAEERTGTIRDIEYFKPVA